MTTWHPEPKVADLIVKAENIHFTIDEYISAQTLSADNFLVIVSGNVKLTLPPVGSHNERGYTIKNIGTGRVTLATDDTIDGEDEIALNLQYQYISIRGDSKNETWHIVGGINMKLDDLLDKKLSEQINLLERIRREVKETKLHQAYKTGQSFTSKDLG